MILKLSDEKIQIPFPSSDGVVELCDTQYHESAIYRRKLSRI